MAILLRRLLSIPACCLSFLIVIANTGCGGGSPSVPPPKTLKSISVAPSTANIAAGATQQFTATGTYSDGSTANLSSTASWTVATPAVATINSNGLTTGVAAGSSIVSASLSGIGGKASLTVTASVGGVANVVTWHFDAHRTGLNA